MVFVITFCVFIIFFVALSLGLLIKNKPLKGSCGGVAKLMGNKNCDICGGDPNRCESENNDRSIEGSFYNADKEKR